LPQDKYSCSGQTMEMNLSRFNYDPNMSFIKVFAVTNCWQYKSVMPTIKEVYLATQGGIEYEMIVQF
jgi:hypothetical protein